MQDRTIDSALLALRVQLIRDDGPGLEHVEALLAMRGCDLEPIPRSGVISFRKNELRRLILAALGDGPQPLKGIAAYIASRKPDVPHRRAYIRASCVLARMRRAGWWSMKGRCGGCPSET